MWRENPLSTQRGPKKAEEGKYLTRLKHQYWQQLKILMGREQAKVGESLNVPFSVFQE